MAFSGVTILCRASLQGLLRSLGSSILIGAMRALLHLLVILLCLAYRACSCSLLFKAPHPITPIYYYIFYIVLIIIYSVSFPLFFQFSMMGAGAGCFWWAGLVAGLQVGWALGYSGCLGLGSAVPVPHVPGHPTSICDEGVNLV